MVSGAPEPPLFREDRGHLCFQVPSKLGSFAGLDVRDSQSVEFTDALQKSPDEARHISGELFSQLPLGRPSTPILSECYRDPSTSGQQLAALSLMVSATSSPLLNDSFAHLSFF